MVEILHLWSKSVKENESAVVALLMTANLQFKGACGSMRLPPEDYKITSQQLIVAGEKPPDLRMLFHEQKSIQNLGTGPSQT